MSRAIVKNTIGQLNDLQNGTTWFDDNIENKINQISENQAFIRPIPELHSVAELVSHMLVWRKDSLNKLKGLPSKLTMESPENWEGNEYLKKAGWARLKSDLSESMKAMVEFLDTVDDEYLANNHYNGKDSLKYLVEGIVQHDLYHLGQIGITIKLLKSNKAD